MSGATLTISVGDNGHVATLTCLNLDGTPAVGVDISYSSDLQLCAVDPVTGALTPTAAGVATITGTGVRGGFTHSDSSQVTVTGTNPDDFTVSLGLA